MSASNPCRAISKTLKMEFFDRVLNTPQWFTVLLYFQEIKSANDLSNVYHGEPAISTDTNITNSAKETWHDGTANETKYSKMGQVKFVKDHL